MKEKINESIDYTETIEVLPEKTKQYITKEILELVKKYQCTITICESVFDDVCKSMKNNATL